MTDAAGEVVAVGRQVKDVHKGERVTSTYFKNWVDGPFSHERLDHVPGWTADGVLADYIVLGSTDAIPIPDGMMVLFPLAVRFKGSRKISKEWRLPLASLTKAPLVL